MTMSRLSARERACLLLDLSRREADDYLRGRLTAAPTRGRGGTEWERAGSPLPSPSRLASHRVDPNTLTEGQWHRLDDFESLVARAPKGRPFYSLGEVVDATGIPTATVADLFVPPSLAWSDKPNGTTRHHHAVHGRYLVDGSIETDALRACSFEPVDVTHQGMLRLAESTTFEDPTHADDLKARHPGGVHPILVDGEGFHRYLVPGTVDIWLHDLDPGRVQSLVSAAGLRVDRLDIRHGHCIASLVRPPADGNVTGALLEVTERLNTLGEVRFAEPMQFDPLPPADPGITTTVDEFEATDRDWNHAAIGLQQAHAVTTGSDTVTVAVVDSGVWMEHPVLSSRFRDGWQALDLHYGLDAEPAFTSPNERALAHGTKVTGVVAGLAAIAPDCRVLPIKVSGSAGGTGQPGYGLRAEAILAALDAVQPGHRMVINMSWRTNGEIISIREALRTAAERDVVLCASAGNYSSWEPQQPDAIHYPSSHAWREPANPALLSVGALAPGDRKATYSYYGASSVSLMAPGGESGQAGTAIFTTSTPEKYSFTYGTSFASPHAAAVAALVLAVRPATPAADVVALLRSTAADLDPSNPAHAGLLGAGRLDAAAAVAAARALGGAGPQSGSAGTVGDDEHPPDEIALSGSGDGAASSGDNTGSTGDLVDLNSATRDELAAVDGIGWYRAGVVVTHREQYGPFLALSDLLLTGVFVPADVHDLAATVSAG